MKHIHVQLIVVMTLLILGGLGLYYHVEYSGWLVFFGVLGALDLL